MKNVTFIGTCVGLSGSDIDAFDETAREITYKTFLKNVGRGVVDELNEWSGVPLRKDWSVSFEKGKWKGKNAYCLHHSMIHHIWTVD